MIADETTPRQAPPARLEMSRGLLEATEYRPDEPQAPRFFTKTSWVRELKPCLSLIERTFVGKRVTYFGVEDPALGDCWKWGPDQQSEEDADLERRVCERFGIRRADAVVESGRDVQVRSTSRSGSVGPGPFGTWSPDADGLTRPGRPAKYPFRELTKVGDSFLAVGADKHRLQCSANNYLKSRMVRDVCKFAFIAVNGGVLVVLVANADDTARFTAPSSDEASFVGE